MSIRSRLHEAEEENPLMPLVLGAIASLDALEHAIAGTDQPGTAADRAPRYAPLAPDDPLVLATLGLLGLGRALRGWLATAVATAPSRDLRPAGASPDERAARDAARGSGSLAR